MKMDLLLIPKYTMIYKFENSRIADALSTYSIAIKNGFNCKNVPFYYTMTYGY